MWHSQEANVVIVELGEKLVRRLRKAANRIQKHQAACPETGTDNDAAYTLSIEAGYDGQEGWLMLKVAHSTDCDWLETITED